jgi:hypothetical protein
MIGESITHGIPMIENKNEDPNKINLLIGVTGSVAAIKLK